MVMMVSGFDGFHDTVSYSFVQQKNKQMVAPLTCVNRLLDALACLTLITAQLTLNQWIH